MAAYYVSQGYDAPRSVIWPILIDFASWPRWFPNISTIAVENATDEPRAGSELLAVADDGAIWTRWRVAEWTPPTLLVCEHVDTNAPMSGQLQSAYIQFELIDDAEGCTLEVELGADGYGLMGDFFVGVTLGSNVRRVLPKLVESFSEHVVVSIAARR